MQYATETLIHYLKTVWEEAGLKWNGDNESEVEGIIQSIERDIDAKLKKHKTYSEEMRQKIASEQLAAIIIRDADVPPWGMKDPDIWMVEKSIRLTDLLLKKLAKEPDA